MFTVYARVVTRCWTSPWYSQTPGRARMGGRTARRSRSRDPSSCAVAYAETENHPHSENILIWNLVDSGNLSSIWMNALFKFTLKNKSGNSQHLSGIALKSKTQCEKGCTCSELLLANPGLMLVAPICGSSQTFTTPSAQPLKRNKDSK